MKLNSRTSSAFPVLRTSAVLMTSTTSIAYITFYKLIKETQRSKLPKATRHHYAKKYWPFYPSEPFTFVHFTLIHPVLQFLGQSQKENDRNSVYDLRYGSYIKKIGTARYDFRIWSLENSPHCALNHGSLVNSMYVTLAGAKNNHGSSFFLISQNPWKLFFSMKF